MKKTLYPVQQTHAKILSQAITKYGAALDGSDTGTGKTLVAAEIAANVTNPVFVLCPKSLCPMWSAELKDRGVKPIAIVNYELLRRGKLPWGKWTRGQWVWSLPNDTLLVVDEVQKCKSPSSQNGRMLLAAKPYFVLALSATAAESSAELRALGYILSLHQLGNWWSWARERGCSVNHWGHLEFNDDPKVLEALHKEIFPEHGHRMHVSDLADHFTETQIITTPLDFGSKVKRLYAEMEKELANLAEVMISDSTHPAAQALVVTLRARQSVELCKVPLMLEMIDDLVREGRSVAVFMNFTATLDAIQERSEWTCATVDGRTVGKDREDMVAAFQTNKVPVILCNIQSGSVGISLHDIHGAHPRTAIISPSWSAYDTIQAMGRVHRAGGQTPSQIHVLFSAGTIEEQVQKVVLAKTKNIAILNDGNQS